MLIFDRGCLHNIPRPRWPAYFAEIDRLLAPGGIFQLLLIRPGAPSPLSLHGLGAWLRRPRRQLARRKPAELFHERLRGHLSASMQILEMTEFAFARRGRRRTLVHLLARKTHPD